MAKDFRGGDFFVSLDGRAGAAALGRWAALPDFLVGFFLLTDKGSPRRKKGKKPLFKMCNDLKIVIGIRGRNERV
ncbi:MAG: hypothetical protein KKG98_08065 [Proteobacteria bacterium]|nr:hypothetical protein [Pseudomonadota bacterium]